MKREREWRGEGGRQYRRLITPRPVFIFPSPTPGSTRAVAAGAPLNTLYPSLREPGEFLRLPGGWVGTKGVDSVPSHPAPIRRLKRTPGDRCLEFLSVTLSCCSALRDPKLRTGQPARALSPHLTPHLPCSSDSPQAPSPTYLGRATSGPTRRQPVQSACVFW